MEGRITREVLHTHRLQLLAVSGVWGSTSSGLPGGSDGKESAMWEIWVQSLSWDNPLEKGMVTHSSILAWRISWTEGPGRQQSTRLQRVRHDWATFTFIFWSFNTVNQGPRSLENAVTQELRQPWPLPGTWPQSLTSFPCSCSIQADVGREA